MNKGSFISKDESTMIQGIAVTLMVIHHLLGFPERISVQYYHVLDFSFFHFETMLGYFGRICIAIFAFNSGYGIMKKMNSFYSSKIDILKRGYKLAGHQLKKFYMMYWLIFIAFIPYGMVTSIYSFRLSQFVKNFLGIASNYNSEWWYVSYYLQMMILFPIVFFVGSIIKSIIKDQGIALLVLISLFICIVCKNMPKHSFICMFFCFCIGSLSVYYSIFEKLYEWVRKDMVWRGILLLIVFGGAIFVRVFISQNIDYIIAPVLVFSIGVFIKSRICFDWIKKILTVIGRYSTYIWLTHTFFAYYYWQKLLYSFRYSTLIVMICIVACIMVGFVFEYLKKGLGLKLIRRDS